MHKYIICKHICIHIPYTIRICVYTNIRIYIYIHLHIYRQAALQNSPVFRDEQINLTLLSYMRNSSNFTMPTFPFRFACEQHGSVSVPKPKRENRV